MGRRIVGGIAVIWGGSIIVRTAILLINKFQSGSTGEGFSAYQQGNLVATIFGIVLFSWGIHDLITGYKKKTENNNAK